MFLSKAFSMKSINTTLMICLLSMASIIHTSQNGAQLAQMFLNNPTINQFSYPEFVTLTEYIATNPYVFCNISGTNALYKTASDKENRTLDIDILVKGGADKGINEKGYTAANEAIADRHITLRALQNLIAHKINFNTKNCYNLTSIQFAIQTKNKLAVALLAPTCAQGLENSRLIDFARNQYADLENQSNKTSEETEYTKKGSLKIAMDATSEIIKILEPMNRQDK